MALTDAYVQVYSQLPEFFQKIREGQAPPKFTTQYLKDIGFTSSNFRAVIPLLKALGFLSPDGSPTTRYHSYRDLSQSRTVMGEALREAYGDLFTIKASPADSDKALIEGKFKSVHNTNDRLAKLMSSTFYGLLGLADVHARPARVDRSERADEKSNEKQKPVPETHGATHRPTLHYNIQIHLPATKDVEVFNAIFKSLKEHLLD